MRDDIDVITRATDRDRAHQLRMSPTKMTWCVAQNAARECRASQWFEYGCECEADGELREAAAAYRNAIGLSPELADAHFNLGNVLRSLGELRGSAQHFRQALRCNQQYAPAWYNLADVHDDLGETADAIACLKRAIALVPDYADAHFNLAVLYESAGQLKAAARHWTRYLALDVKSTWAVQARRSLTHCLTTSLSQTALQLPAT